MLLGGTNRLTSRPAVKGFRAPPWNNPDEFVVLMADWGVSAIDNTYERCARDARGSWLAISGQPLWVQRPTQDSADGFAQCLLKNLEAQGLKALGNVDGSFSIVWWCAPEQRLRLIRDRFGIEPLYYAQPANELLFASRIRDLVATGLIERKLSPDGLAEFLAYCYLPGTHTMHHGVLRVPPGHCLVASPADNSIRIESWYRLSFVDGIAHDEQEITSTYRSLLERAVTRRVGPQRPAVFLSGGMDSSSVATFARRHWKGEVSSFGFRCAGNSFDESFYARGLAEALQLKHVEVEYGAERALGLKDAVREMEVPFCDIGIELGTWMLGSAAKGHTEYVLTGDGGDEIWASHPVYSAQKLMRWYDRARLPRALSDGLWRLSALLSDSDQKRNLTVILKRILPRPGTPTELQHFRWKTYCPPVLYAKHLTTEWAGKLGHTDPFACVRSSFDGYTGPDDGISPLLYSDYTTASGFYFSRLMLLRQFGMDARLPFYDKDLVEFGARIPAHMKLEGLERTKRLFRKAMQGVLPDVVNARKDKLGHSVPFKNWLRTPSVPSAMMDEALSPRALSQRGLFRPEDVACLIDEHRRRRHNHSHRLWSLVVLEQWLQAWM